MGSVLHLLAFIIISFFFFFAQCCRPSLAFVNTQRRPQQQQKQKQQESWLSLAFARLDSTQEPKQQQQQQQQPSSNFLSPFPRQNAELLLQHVDDIIRKRMKKEKRRRKQETEMTVLDDNHLYDDDIDGDDDNDWTLLPQQIHQRVVEEHARDALLHKELETENVPLDGHGETDTEWVHSRNTPRLALRTKGGNPILTPEEIQVIRQTATRYWDDSSSSTSSSSRFTYQRPGNQEAHLLDLCRYDDHSDAATFLLRPIIQKVLSQRLYPLITEQFGVPNPKLYDSLIIRYNATAAAIAANDDGATKSSSSSSSLLLGAGQPLHRDLGLVSVNVMLNDDYEGGGTLFEDMIFADEEGGQQRHPHRGPLKPAGVGHALLHGSYHRHAGVRTTGGTVRDIWVLFVTSAEGTPREWSMRYKGMAMQQKEQQDMQDGAGDDDDKQRRLQEQQYWLERLLFHRMAVGVVPTDGEGWHYMGMSLQPICKNKDLVLRCLFHASTLIPNDARLWNNMGLVLEQQLFLREAEVAFRRSLELHDGCQQLGCDVEDDRNQAILNYGLCLANQDEFAAAANILEKLDYPQGSGRESLTQVQEDALRLKAFCAAQAMM